MKLKQAEAVNERTNERTEARMRLLVSCRGSELAVVAAAAGTTAMDVDASGKGHGYIGTH